MRFILHSLVALAFAVCCCIPTYGGAETQTPEYVRIELKRLEETWRLLDQGAEKVWPGWNGYRDVPFRFSYPNGVILLVGHPDPPDGYDLVQGLEASGKKVYIDRRLEVPLPIKAPLLGGGGPLPFGKTSRVETVDLRMRDATIKDPPEPGQPAKEIPDALRVASENQILINIHEIFHCFQRKVYQYRYGNLRFNPDLEYALYADVESRALANAYAASDDSAAREYLKDFLVARSLKRKSMTELEQNQESEDELMEGTAVYAETRLLQLLKEGYSPRLTVQDDPFFLGFRDLDFFLSEKSDRLKESGLGSLEARGKCYAYGSFQALLLTRLFPGWQKDFFQKGRLLTDDITKALAIKEKEREDISARLEERYKISELRTKHATIGRRDAAYASIQARQGRTYIVNFKPTGDYVIPEGYGDSFRIGLMELFPDGIRQLKINEVLFAGQKTPIMEDQLYYLKWVDTDWKPGEKGYELTFGRSGGPDIYYDAEVKTRGFTLKAPKIRLSDGARRVKITVLAKVPES